VLAENNIRGVKFVQEPIIRSQSAIAVKKGNATLLGDINAALADIRRDGTHDRIITSWQSKEVVFKTREQLRQQTWLIAAIAATLIVALAGVAVLVREIRRRKHVEATLRENEDRLRNALEAADLGTFDLDIKTGIAVHSLRHDQMFGYREPVPEWTLEIAIQHVLPEDRPLVLEAHARAEKTGVLAFEARVVWPDGSIHWIAPRGTVHYDGEGRPVHLIGVIADITDRKRTEEDTRRHVEVLSASNAELTRLAQAMVGRELRMIELKEEVNALCAQAGEPTRYEAENLEARP
jgi:PAS domain S-box-containing protein